ncbi:MAG: DinB family protein, partial [Planctomycetota bacterium]
SEGEAVWQGAAWHGVEREEGWPAPGTIAWQVAHVAHCKTYYARCMLHAIERGPEPEVIRDPAASFAEERERLWAAHQAQRSALVSVDDGDLEKPVVNGASLAEFLSTTIRHDIWHAGQIAVIRRLYRETGQATVSPP